MKFMINSMKVGPRLRSLRGQKRNGKQPKINEGGSEQPDAAVAAGGQQKGGVEPFSPHHEHVNSDTPFDPHHYSVSFTAFESLNKPLTSVGAAGILVHSLHQNINGVEYLRTQR